jgi:GNAT superfamily N-acetyltransferase
MRGKGIGEALLNKVVAYGKENNVQRIGWVVLDWNHGAIKFYKQKGAVIQTNWNIAQLDKEAIANFNTNNE